LIQGETGTGKEVLARYIHAVSHRSNQPFLACNCGAFSETVLESELFGHEKGSFTGAIGRKRGIFELAHKGTLFLDEIDSASPAIQVKLLRVLESGEFFRVGGEELCKVDMRVIAATNANLASKVEQSMFREDLFYRLDVASLNIPPLRERVRDIPIFLNYFLEKETTVKNAPAKRFCEEAMKILLAHTWPGNIRELMNTVSQSVLLSKGPVIAATNLPDRIRDKSRETDPDTNIAQSHIDQDDADQREILFSALPQPELLTEMFEQIEDHLIKAVRKQKEYDFSSVHEDLKHWSARVTRKIIQEALDETYGNQVKAAKLLGITPQEKVGIPPFKPPRIGS
jgi:two-component system NtrC family response regulator